jgi:ribosomal-protein-alanine N-acetyltransferase
MAAHGPDVITILPMAEADLDDVLVIETASFPRPWTREHFIDELRSPYAFPLAARDGAGRLLGFICLRVLLDEGHILDVAVQPELRGCGVGRLLVERGLAECRARGAALVGLEVRVSNAAAIALYGRFGFREAGRRPGYYENGEAALLMEYHFSPNGERNAV